MSRTKSEHGVHGKADENEWIGENRPNSVRTHEWKKGCVNGRCIMKGRYVMEGMGLMKAGVGMCVQMENHITTRKETKITTQPPVPSRALPCPPSHPPSSPTPRLTYPCR